MTDWLLQLLAGDRAASYRDVWFAFDVAGVLAFGALLVVFGASLAYWFWRLQGNPKKWTLVILRALALTLALFLLLGPALVARRLE
ncbi:MAG: hypothetical protein QGG64_21905, partial [Candidatus Latescibacteria bacterium]|nr:hypothetical protein [Candidatus Latescibacterota bacterium]